MPPLYSILFVSVHVAVFVLSLHDAFSIYTTWPSHAGAVDEPTNTGVTVLPHASIIFAGAPGFTASGGHDTVEVVLVGAVKPPMYSIVYVCVHVAVVVPSHAV